MNNAQVRNGNQKNIKFEKQVNRTHIVTVKFTVNWKTSTQNDRVIIIFAE